MWMFGLLLGSRPSSSLPHAFTLNRFKRSVVDEDDSLFSFSLAFITALPGCHANIDAHREQGVKKRQAPALSSFTSEKKRATIKDSLGRADTQTAGRSVAFP